MHYLYLCPSEQFIDKMDSDIYEILKNSHLPESSVSELTVPARTVLLEENEIADRIYFIRSGCLRLSYNNDGKDVTFQFFFPGSVVASFDSLYNRTPSLFSLESIDRSELVAVDFTAAKALLDMDNGIRERYERFLVERFHVYQQLFLSRIRNSPQQRYEELLKQNPEIVKNIPLHYIASYLGITPVSLSRIRSRLHSGS